MYIYNKGVSLVDIQKLMTRAFFFCAFFESTFSFLLKIVLSFVTFSPTMSLSFVVSPEFFLTSSKTTLSKTKR